MKKLNVALVGCWHPHVPRYYPILQKREDTALTCVWDSTAERGANWARKLGIPFVADYAELLKRSDVDAVCIVAETCRHAELMKKAMAALDGEMRRRGLASRMLLQVHDELIFEVPVGELEEMRSLVRECMEGAAKLSVKSFFMSFSPRSVSGSDLFNGAKPEAAVPLPPDSSGFLLSIFILIGLRNIR